LTHSSVISAVLDTPDGLPRRRRYVAIIAVSLGTILTTVDGSVVNVALPTLARDLHVRPSAAVLVVTIYQLVLMMTPAAFFSARRPLRPSRHLSVWANGVRHCDDPVLFRQKPTVPGAGSRFPGTWRRSSTERELGDDPIHLPVFAAWARSELQHRHRRLFGVTRTALPCIGSLVAYSAMMIVMVTLPFRLQEQFHFTPAAAGAVLAPLPLVSMIVAPTSGLLSDRFSAGLLGAIGMGIGLTGMICLAFLPASPNHFDIVWRIAICGLGTGMFFSPNARQILGSAPLERSVAAGALSSTIRGTGQTLGATAVAALLAGGFGISPTPPLIAAALALIAGFCSLAVIRSPPRRPQHLSDVIAD
jgi:MFS family permease